MGGILLQIFRLPFFFMSALNIFDMLANFHFHSRADFI